MAPHEGLVHLKEYDIKDSNVELIGTDIDHRLKHASAATEPAWNDGRVAREPGLLVWRIEDFAVVPVQPADYGTFFDGDSYIVLHSYRLGSRKKAADEEEREEAEVKLGHDIFFWLGAHTSQDEAGVAAYKTVELDEFLHGAATQHRELQASPSDEFAALFPRITVRSGGVRSGFRHVDADADSHKKAAPTLLRVFAHGRSVVVHEVEPAWQSLDDGDVFILDVNDKIYVWQGSGCSPMEKAKAAQVVHDMTLAKHVDVEVLAQAESRSRLVVSLLGGEDDTPQTGLQQERPVALRAPAASESSAGGDKKLFRLSDASGQLSFSLAKDGRVSEGDLDGNDVFILDDGGRAIWVWEGNSASRAEKASWLKVAQAYVRRLQGDAVSQAYLTPVAKVRQGYESPAFLKAIAT